jgi:hypothetical protein
VPDSFIEVTEGTGKKLAAFERTVNSQTVQDQRFVLAEPFLPSYTVAITTEVSLATANSHLLQIMAGANKRLLLRRIKVTQLGAASTAQVCVFQLVRLTTAGTGGTAYTPRQFDPADGNAEATAMTLPSSKGTEGVGLWTETGVLWSTVPTAGSGQDVVDLDFRSGLRTKPPTIAAGTSNGLALKNVTAITTTPTVHIYAEFVEDA